MSPIASATPDVAVPLIRSRPAGARDPRPGLAGVSPETLSDWVMEHGGPAYRVRQIGDAFWAAAAGSTDRMRTLPGPLRKALEMDFRIDTIAGSEVRVTDGGLTEKALHRLDDGRLVESVLMRYPARGGRRERATVCVSSQAGCAVGCPFCATGELGFMRDLDASEIVDQVRFWRRRLNPEDQRITNVVFMGMGEPLLNAAAVFAAGEALTDPQRFGLGARHLTVSTSGVIPAMQRLTLLDPQWTLAVSLHAARPALREILVPLTHRYPVDQVVAAADGYASATGRRVSYEVVMIDGINDTPLDAEAMGDLLVGRLAHVNLIPMNPVAHTPWRPSPPARLGAFAAVLRGRGLSVTIRRNRGIEIGAACGQLAAEQGSAPTPAVVARRRDSLVRRSAAALTVGASA
jgi:23S rRNA (adenine2503-C2)-methyltransferase